MKVTVKIDNRSFEVDVGDLHARPIIATIDGERFEVWGEAPDTQTDNRMNIAEPAPAAGVPLPHPMSIQHAAPSVSNGSVKAIRAPIPGVIISVAVKPGEMVKAGQELCVLEAMKMKNAIRLPRDGTVRAINVSVGQQVAHGTTLMVFTD